MSAINHHVVVVEDEVKISTLLRDYLSNAGYRVSLLHEGSGAVEFIRDANPSCVVLDLMLPGKDGLDICRELRQFSDVPIVMVTARVDEIDRLIGLELGADDYVCKPFSPREVVARIRNILRRVDTNSPVNIRSANINSPDNNLVDNESVENDHVRYRALHLDQSRLLCEVNGTTVVLTAVEYRMLFTMASLPGRIFSRNKLMDAAYTDGRIVSDRTIDTHIKNMRKKLSDASDGELIHSIYGVGYKVE